MDNLNIEIAEAKDAFRPGQTIKGTVRWNLQENPQSLEISLFWHTSGKGTKDVGVVETIKFDNPGSLGQKDFKFKLPKGPYTFSGKLISLIWAIEATTIPTEKTTRQKITISPTTQEILLK